MPKLPKPVYVAQQANSEDKSSATYVAEVVDSDNDPNAPTVDDFLEVLRKRGSL